MIQQLFISLICKQIISGHVFERLMKNIKRMNFRQRKVHHGSQEIFIGDVEREKEGPMVRLN